MNWITISSIGNPGALYGGRMTALIILLVVFFVADIFILIYVFRRKMKKRSAQNKE
jgi:hypothetical protein